MADLPDLPAQSDSKLAREHPHVFLGVYGVLGLLVAAACAWGFFALADEFTEQGWMSRMDLSVTNWLQVHGTETGESIFYAISYLGSPVLAALIVVVAILLIRRRDWRRLGALVLICVGGELLNLLLKAIYHRTRPVFASEFSPTGSSFPSGHAMDSLIVYGFFAFWLIRIRPTWRIPVLITAVALIGAIGFARIYLGVHYLSDVIGGYMAGFVWLVVCITGYRFAVRRHVGTGAHE